MSVLCTIQATVPVLHAQPCGKVIDYPAVTDSAEPVRHLGHHYYPGVPAAPRPTYGSHLNRPANGDECRCRPAADPARPHQPLIAAVTVVGSYDFNTAHSTGLPAVDAPYAIYRRLEARPYPR